MVTLNLTFHSAISPAVSLFSNLTTSVIDMIAISFLFSITGKCLIRFLVISVIEKEQLIGIISITDVVRALRSFRFTTENVAYLE